MSVSRRNLDDFLSDLGKSRVTYFDKNKLEGLFKVIDFPKPLRAKWDLLPNDIPEMQLAEFIRDNLQKHEDWRYYTYMCVCFDLKMDKNLVPIFNEKIRYEDLNKKALWTLVIYRNVLCTFYDDFPDFHCITNLGLNNEIFDVCIKIGRASVLIDIFEDNCPCNGHSTKEICAKSKRYEYACLHVPFAKEMENSKNSKKIKKHLENIVSIIKKVNNYDDCRIQ